VKDWINQLNNILSLIPLVELLVDEHQGTFDNATKQQK
jgi:hypothetical protein